MTEDLHSSMADMNPNPQSSMASWAGIWHGDEAHGRVEIWTRSLEADKIVWSTFRVNLYSRPGFESEWDRTGGIVWPAAWSPPPLGYWKDKMSFREGDGWGVEVKDE